MNTLFIVNPEADRGKCFRRWTRFEELLHERANFPYAVRLTQKTGDARNFAVTAVKEGFSRIISVGGDGTVSEVINGVAMTDIHVGILPFGTGNDLARAFHFGTNFISLLKKLESPTLTPIDIVKINDQYFVNAAGLGIDGLVVQHLNQHPIIKKLGKAGYTISALQVLWNFRSVKMSVSIDGEDSVLSKVWMFAIANGPFFGGGMKICPMADPSDGWLDLCIVQNLSKTRFIRLFPHVFSGKHILHDQYVTFRKARKVLIHDACRLPLQTDGEIVSTTCYTIEIIPRGIQLIT